MKTFFKLLLAVLLISIISLGCISYSRFQTPTTAEMEEFFAAHQVGFEKKNAAILTALAKKTVIDSSADTQIGCQWIETQPRPDSYQKGEPVKIRYYTHLRGIGVSAFGTGIAYIAPANQEKNYPNLEAMRSEAKKIEGFVGYSHIIGNWHSFLWEAD